jgi:hypothetical protein
MSGLWSSPKLVIWTTSQNNCPTLSALFHGGEEVKSLIHSKLQYYITNFTFGQQYHSERVLSIYFTGASVGPRTNLDTSVKRKILSLPRIHLQLFSTQLVTLLTDVSVHLDVVVKRGKNSTPLLRFKSLKLNTNFHHIQEFVGLYCYAPNTTQHGTKQKHNWRWWR